MPMRYGFLDESGDVDPFSGTRFLVVAALSTAAPRPIELHIKRARKRLRERPASGEMKATHSREAIIERVLRAIAQEDVRIIAVIVDKQSIMKAPENPEAIYQAAVIRAVRHCVERWPRFDLYLDKRYTKKALRYRLEEVIREALVGVPQEVVLIRQEDSLTRKELQAVDFVAWSLFQKYERGEDRFYRIIEDKVLVEELVKRELW